MNKKHRSKKLKSRRKCKNKIVKKCDDKFPSKLFEKYKFLVAKRKRDDISFSNNISTFTDENNKESITTTGYYNTQANKARFVYTILATKPENDISSLLPNGHYFCKVSRSDELFRLTETQMSNILRTLYFSALFTNVEPYESMYDIIYSNTITFPKKLHMHCPYEDLTYPEFADIIDDIFGNGFSIVSSKPLLNVYLEYITKWRYFNYGTEVRFPSIYEYVETYKFLSIINWEIIDGVLFVILNQNDHKSFLQGTKKVLPSLV